MKIFAKTCGLSFLICSQLAWAHGMDQMGPHKGFIKMPGAFHTEVVPQKNGSFKVYLLDIEFKNPTIKNSEVIATLKSPSATQALSCQAQADHFVCQSTKSLKDSTELLVTAKRDGAPGSEAVYSLPLKVEKH